MNDSVFLAGIVVVGWIISVCFHEFSHALVAYFGGDTSVKNKGYLHMNPFAYTDVRLSIILPTLFMMIGGIGLPGASVLIREDRLRSPLWSSMVSAAGPLATFLFSIVLLIVIKSGTLPLIWVLAFCWLLNIEILVLILNLLPIPGLDGFGIIEPFMPRALKERLRPFYKHGFIILIAILWIVKPANYLLWGLADLFMLLAGIHPQLIDQGQALYRQGSFPIAASVIATASIVYLLKKKFDQYERCQDLLKAKKYDDCLKELSKILEKKPEAKAYRLKAIAICSLAESDEAATDSTEALKEALSAIDRAAALDPESFENFWIKGFICHAAGLLEEALQAYKKALDLNRDCDAAFINTCKILRVQERYEECLDLCDQRLKLLPGDPETLFQKGLATASAGSFEESIKLFETCVKAGVHKEESESNIKLILEKKSNVEQA
ncbi:MAG: tetratricopeptide repeat protein [Candidatus Obscuribacterales bacterium]|nr:tetratricopeptide repeat protein [Candidatus Obscuribacterales bacterium]